MTSFLPPSFCRQRTRAWRILRCIVVGVVAAATSTAAAAGQTPGIVTAKLTSVTPRLTAYARVEPVSTLQLNAAATGVISGLTVVPGMHVHAGEKLASLHGPAVRALLLQDKVKLRSAHAQLSQAKKTLAIQREQLRAHLSTRVAVHRAESAVAQAQAVLDDAQSRLAAEREMAAIVAPTKATVTQLNSSNGEFVDAGQPVVTLQSTHALWLRASYYGKDMKAIHVGMTGVFHPENGTHSVPVRVRATFGAISAGGGAQVAMTPLRAASPWLNGEFGTVTLRAPKRKLVAVPTRALILSRGKWWVMVHTSHGDHPQEVVPGPAQGWTTFILHGLAPGSRVVVSHAYLLFHGHITQRYQSPD